MKVSHDLSVCQDCICWIANADDTGLDILSEEDAEAIRATRDASEASYTSEPGSYISYGGEELGFCHSRCDLCNALPGDRYSAHVLGN